MIDIVDFLKLLIKRKYILIGIPLVTVIITYFLVRNLPDTFSSKARIATGIVDDSQQSLGKNNKPESEISQEFNSLIQMMQLKKIIDQVSYRLMLHDLTSNQPFRKPSSLLKDLNESARKHAIAVYTEKVKTMTELSLYDKDQNGLYEVLKSMGYDEESIRSKLLIYRLNNGDYIDIQYESENPELSAFVPNTICKEFIAYYTTLVRDDQNKTVDFLAKLLQEKYDAMNQKMEALKSYKIQNHVLNLNEQAKSLYGQIADFETRKQTAEKEIISYTAALNDIDAKFQPNDRKYLESSLSNINESIISTKDQLRTLNDKYVNSNFDEQYKGQIDSLRKKLASQINLSSDKYILNPLSAKQDLVTQKLQMEVSLDLAKNSVASLQTELNRLSNKFNSLVPHEAVVQSLENAIDVASREYLEILDKYNQTSFNTNFTTKLRQIELAMPGSPQPSKKMLLVILSGIISFVFCVVILFVLFYIDDSIQRGKDLANQTKLPVLGNLNTMSGSLVDLKQIWKESDTNEERSRFKDLLRSIRFEIENELGTGKLLAVTSLKKGEGKTFFSISLAYAYAMTSKKVLLLDGNFKNPVISETVKSSLFIEDLMKSSSDTNLAFGGNDLVTIMGNKGGDKSLLEIADQATIKNKLDQLKNQFDIIIIEASSLDTMNKAKEWMTFADKVVAVFAADQSLSESKKQLINYLKGLDKTFAGWVLNKTKSKRS